MGTILEEKKITHFLRIHCDGFFFYSVMRHFLSSVYTYTYVLSTGFGMFALYKKSSIITHV